jgi:hypothetical protein
MLEPLRASTALAGQARGRVGHRSDAQREVERQAAEASKISAQKFGQACAALLVKGHPFAPCNGVFKQRQPDPFGLPRFQNANGIILYCRDNLFSSGGVFYLNDRYEPKSFMGYAFGSGFFDLALFESGTHQLTTSIWSANDQEWQFGKLALTLLKTDRDTREVPASLAGPFVAPAGGGGAAKGEALDDRREAEAETEAEAEAEAEARKRDGEAAEAAAPPTHQSQEEVEVPTTPPKQPWCCCASRPERERSRR